MISDLERQTARGEGWSDGAIDRAYKFRGELDRGAMLMHYAGVEGGVEVLVGAETRLPGERRHLRARLLNVIADRATVVLQAEREPVHANIEGPRARTFDVERVRPTFATVAS